MHLHWQYKHLMRKLHAEDVASFTNFTTKEPQTFYEILTRISKQDANYRKALTPGLKLAITFEISCYRQQLQVASIWISNSSQQHL